MTHLLAPLAPFAAALAAATAAPAQPADAFGPAPQARVGYADLNLATADGRAILDARVAAAIGRLCPPADIHDLARAKAVAACRAAARAGAEPQLTAAASRALMQARASGDTRPGGEN